MNEPQHPRDWLLQRHRPAERQLDALRAQALPAPTPDLTTREVLAALFRPHRHLWRALTITWAAMLAFHFLQPRPVPPPASRPSPEAVAAWLSQLKNHEIFAQIHHGN